MRILACIILLLKINAREIDSKFYSFMEKLILATQDGIISQIPKDLSRSGLAGSIKHDLISPLLLDLKSRSVNNPTFMPMIRTVVKGNLRNLKGWLKYKLPAILRTSKLHKRTWSIFNNVHDQLQDKMIDQQLVKWDPALWDSANNVEWDAFDDFSKWDEADKKSWDDLIKSIQVPDVVQHVDNAVEHVVEHVDNAVEHVVEHVDNVAPARVKDALTEIDPSYYSNMIKNYFYGGLDSLQDITHGQIKKAGKSLTSGVTEQAIDELSPRLQQAILDNLEIMAERLPVAAKEASQMSVEEIKEVLKEMLHDFGKALTAGALDGLKIGDSHFHVEAGRTTGAALVKGIVGQILKYGGILALIVGIPLILIVAGVRFFETHLYEANEYPGIHGS